MSTDSDDTLDAAMPQCPPRSLEELRREQGVRPVGSTEELRGPGMPTEEFAAFFAAAMSGRRRVSFERQLDDGVTVVADAAMTVVDPEDPQPGKPCGRVVLVLPDFRAASLARLFDRVWRASRLLGEVPVMSECDMEVAEALRAAAASLGASEDEPTPSVPAESRQP